MTSQRPESESQADSPAQKPRWGRLEALTGVGLWTLAAPGRRRRATSWPEVGPGPCRARRAPVLGLLTADPEACWDLSITPPVAQWQQLRVCGSEPPASPSRPSLRVGCRSGPGLDHGLQRAPGPPSPQLDSPDFSSRLPGKPGSCPGSLVDCPMTLGNNHPGPLVSGPCSPHGHSTSRME